MAKNVSFEVVSNPGDVRILVREDKGYVLLDRVTHPQVAFVQLMDLLREQPGFIKLDPSVARVLDAPLYQSLRAVAKLNNTLNDWLYRNSHSTGIDTVAIDPATDPLRDGNLPEELVGLPSRLSVVESEPGC